MFDNKYFIKFKFTKEQVNKYFNNALKDLDIAKKDKILEVKFNYAYTTLIKASISLLSYYQVRAKSVPGHHVKIIEVIARILEDDVIADLGNIMRSKINLDLYAGGIEVTEKECREYIGIVEKVLLKVKKIITKETVL